jgi:hypothetical protein
LNAWTPNVVQKHADPVNPDYTRKRDYGHAIP